MVTQQVDCFGGLADGLLADAAGVAPLQRHVLPDQQTGRVGGLVELGARDVGVDAKEVEVGLDGELDVTREFGRGGLGQLHPGRAEVRPLEEHLLAVHRERPLPPFERAEPGRQLASVADQAAGGVGEADLDDHLVHRRFAQRMGPPQLGPGDGDGPLDGVVAGREWLLDAQVDTGDGGAEVDRPCVHGVEMGGEGQHGLLGRRLGADDAESGDAHGSGLDHVDRPPQTSGVPFGIDAVPVLEDPGDVALGRAIALGSTGRLDREDVIGTGGHRIGDLEGVREEVALGVADVAAVEPHVALVEEAVEGQPRSAAGRWPLGREPCAVQQRPGRVGEFGTRLPVPRHRDRRPRRVVEVDVGVLTPEVFVGNGCEPRTGQLHRNEPTRPRAEAPWAGRGCVRR